MHRKKIVVYGVKTFPSRGGTDRVAENLVRQLKDTYSITLYCYKDEFAQSHMEGIEVVEFKPQFGGAIGAFWYFFVSAIYLLTEKNVALVHAHKTDCAFFIPLLRIRFKVIATSHEAPYKRDKWNWFIKFYFLLVERLFIKSANLATCISKPLTEYYREKYCKRVEFIPNGINALLPDSYPEDLANPFIKGEATLGKPFILFAARRLMATKGCHTMLEALHKIKYPHQVFIAGELVPNDEYFKRLKKLAVGLNVYFLGFVHPLSSLLALVRQAQYFIFPSETEGMSIMLLEVASVGKLIIASDIPENTEVFEKSEVLYFRTQDADDLATKIVYAENNPEIMRKVEINCQKKVFSSYLWSDIAISYSRLYEEMISVQ